MSFLQKPYFSYRVHLYLGSPGQVGHDRAVPWSWWVGSTRIGNCLHARSRVQLVRLTSAILSVSRVGSLLRTSYIVTMHCTQHNRRLHCSIRSTGVQYECKYIFWFIILVVRSSVFLAIYDDESWPWWLHIIWGWSGWSRRSGQWGKLGSVLGF